MREERVYSKERVKQMSEDERVWAIGMVKSSRSLSDEEKQRNLKVLLKEDEYEKESKGEDNQKDSCYV